MNLKKEIEALKEENESLINPTVMLDDDIAEQAKKLKQK